MRKIFYILTITIGIQNVGFAQIKTSVTGLGDHMAKKEQIKKWRTQNKEKLKQLKQERKLILEKAGQLGNEIGADKHLSSYYKARKHKDRYLTLADSLGNLSERNLKDSAQIEEVKKQLDQQNLGSKELREVQTKAKTYADQYKNYARELKTNDHLTDSLASTIEMMAKKHVKHPAYSDNLVESYEAQLSAREDQIGENREKVEHTGEELKSKSKEDLMFKAKHLGSKHFTGKVDKVESAQKKLTKLKNKYSYVPNSNDLSVARKRNSLSDESFKNRLVIGGNLQIHANKPLGIDFNPYLGYMLDRNWTIGLGATYRSTYGEGSKFISQNEDQVYGGRLFTELMLFKSFFSHGELEALHTYEANPDTESISGKWSNGLLAGLGKRYNFIKKVEGNILILYNFLHKDTGPHSRPWVVRFGFSLK